MYSNSTPQGITAPPELAAALCHRDASSSEARATSGSHEAAAERLGSHPDPYLMKAAGMLDMGFFFPLPRGQ